MIKEKSAATGFKPKLAASQTACFNGICSTNMQLRLAILLDQVSLTVYLAESQYVGNSSVAANLSKMLLISLWLFQPQLSLRITAD